MNATLSLHGVTGPPVTGPPRTLSSGVTCTTISVPLDNGYACIDMYSPAPAEYTTLDEDVEARR